jgi:hypothetical protein
VQRIFYANGSILTGDSIAAAVLSYAQALAKSPLADTITIPFVEESSGVPSRATLLIGPASQLMFVPVIDAGFEEPRDDQLVAELLRRASFIASPRPVPQDPNETVLVSEEFE